MKSLFYLDNQNKVFFNKLEIEDSKIVICISKLQIHYKQLSFLCCYISHGFIYGNQIELRQGN